MKFINKKFTVSLCLILLVLVGCTQNHETLKTDQGEPVTPHQTTLKDSLVIDSENTPEQFFKMTVNDRPQFKEEKNQSNGRLEQIISNIDQSLIIVAIWENLGGKWKCIGISISKSDHINRDDFQVFMRLPYRLIDATTIRYAIQHALTYTQLKNGAGLTIEQKENRIEYLLY